MHDFDEVASHYAQGDLLDAIRRGAERLGKAPEALALDDLAPLDEFHIGGRAATREFLEQMALAADDHVLDLGCGIGGAARFAAATFGCRVSGLDLTPAYVDAGNQLSRWLGLADRVTLRRGNALTIDFPDATFDKAYLLHVGMNVADKAALARELRRVLRPGGVLGIYDVMRAAEGDLEYPVPWATTAGSSWLATPAEYRAALDDAGLQVTHERDRSGFAREFFARLQAHAAAADGPPPLGLHLLMGPTAPTKVRNMVENVARGLIAPVELIARRP